MATLPLYNPTGNNQVDYDAVITYGEWRVTRINSPNEYRSVCFSSYPTALKFASISDSLASAITGVAPHSNNGDFTLVTKLVEGTNVYRYNKDTRTDQGDYSPTNPHYYLNTVNEYTYNYNGLNYRFLLQTTGAGYSLLDASFSLSGIYDIPTISDFSDLINELELEPDSYPIIYNLTNCTAPGAPSSAASGSEVVVNITPSSGYILRSSGVSVIDSNGVTIPHILQGNQIAFTMPYPP